MVKRLGVGFVGAGPVTQAIHLPVLASMAKRFSVTCVMDMDGDVATAVAKSCGARATTDFSSVLNDPAVDVVAICSPNHLHADQVVAACRAGKRGVLCEKPLATSLDDAQRVLEAQRASGTTVIVGTMHSYDPAFRASVAAWNDLRCVATFVRSVIYLPDNDRFVNLATELISSPTSISPPDVPSTPPTEFARFQGSILALAIHNIPLVRHFAPTVDDVLSARALRPFGYATTFRCGVTTVQMLGLLPGAWDPNWRFEAFAPTSRLRVRFPPSYVMAGSSTAEFSSRGSASRWRFAINGYQEEWSHLAGVLDGVVPATTLSAPIEDLRFALRIVELAKKVMVPIQ
jgi:myo-inositol 2-dehydrogenase / D-chiro-inositol 1-dehydrogenase